MASGLFFKSPQELLSALDGVKVLDMLPLVILRKKPRTQGYPCCVANFFNVEDGLKGSKTKLL